MNKKEPVIIRPAGNGWIVEPHGWSDGNTRPMLENLRVFNRFTDMANFLADHFEVQKKKKAPPAPREKYPF